MNILLVEDEFEIRDLMSLHLSRAGYQVDAVDSVEKAMSALHQKKFQIVILDWMLPGRDGLSFIPDVKAQAPQAAVLMVTAKIEENDIVRGLEAGADDYLCKPFNSAVLVARVKALARRAAGPTAGVDPDVFNVDGLYIHYRKHEITLGGEELHLTPSEYKLLVAMTKNQGCVLTRDQLIECTQGEGVNVTGRTVDTHVFGLRKKLLQWGPRIETIRGVGYRANLDSL